MKYLHHQSQGNSIYFGSADSSRETSAPFIPGFALERTHLNSNLARHQLENFGSPLAQLFVHEAEQLLKAYYTGWVTDQYILHRAHALAVLAAEEPRYRTQALSLVIDSCWEIGRISLCIEHVERYVDVLEEDDRLYLTTKILNNIGIPNDGANLLSDNRNYSLETLKACAWAHLTNYDFTRFDSLNKCFELAESNDSDMSWAHNTALFFREGAAIAFERMNHSSQIALHSLFLFCSFGKYVGEIDYVRDFAQQIVRKMSIYDELNEQASVRSICWLYRILSVLEANNEQVSNLKKILLMRGASNPYILFQVGLAELSSGNFELAGNIIREAAYHGFYHRWHLSYQCLISKVPEKATKNLLGFGKQYERSKRDEIRKLTRFL